ncbi:hypothetical protein [Leptolyngbya sp. FACHB-711]|uniref:hypothetical protein n=1 Tax=unclassified Leptolyngbya TaxID=2650499 RepID=UPI00168A1189|nr:hypothetical protein [Leptolyngbya sp. FACHB-711]MBD1848416.1 hypothetical protein [Cyanobacteria bacterium FACHB-502]MBD2024383.1 hypothetical protein [Leptolyngbya sp. FACHB-711]
MSFTTEIEKLSATASLAAIDANSTETTSRIELFSYLLCCAAQGAVGVIGFVCLTLIPIALRQGLLFL